MNKLIIPINENGTISHFTPDFRITRNSYKDVLINLEVPKSMLIEPVIDLETGKNITGNSIRIGAIIRTSRGKNLQTRRYDLTRVKDHEFNNLEYRLYQRPFPKVFTMWETVDLLEATNSGKLELVINIVNWALDENGAEVETIVASPIFELDVYPSEFLEDEEEIQSPSDFELLQSQVQEMQADMEEMNEQIEVINADVNKIETISRNGVELPIDQDKKVDIEVPEKTSEIENDSGFITKAVDDLDNYEPKDTTASNIDIAIDNNSFVMTVSLKNSNNEIISSKQVDLPLEEMIINGDYQEGNLILTLKSGQVVEVDIRDIISGLVTDTRKIAGYNLQQDITVEQLKTTLGIVNLETNKQDKLTFDEEPTADSDNPVKSKGIKAFVERSIGEGLGTTVNVNGSAQIAVSFDSDPQAQLNNKIENSCIGQAGGVAPLNEQGLIPSSHLPSYVDDIIEGYFNSNDNLFYESYDSATDTYSSLISGESGKIYVSLNNNLSYRWSGSVFTEVSKSLTIGETQNTAFAGNRGVALEQGKLNKNQGINNAGKTMTVGLDGNVVPKENRNGLPIGSIFASAVYLTDSAYHLLDGSIISTVGVYEEFANWLIAQGENAPTCTLQEYFEDLSTYGQCGKFVINNSDNDIIFDSVVLPAHSIILPEITEFIASNNGGLTIGMSQLDEFKKHNHTNKYDGYDNVERFVTSFNTGGKVGFALGNNDNNYGKIEITNSGGNETRPKNIRYPYYIVLANAVKTQLEVDINKYIGDLSNKVNIDLTNCTRPYIMETYLSSDGKAWYRKWSDGFKECYIKRNAGGNSRVTILFPITFNNTNTIHISKINNWDSVSASWGVGYVDVFNITGTSFQTYESNASTSSYYACGY